MTYHVLVIFVRLIGFLLFGLGVLVGGLWILVEAANAVAAGGDSVWYLALAFTLLPALIFAFDIARTRSEMAIFFTVASLALVAAVVITYPNQKSACPAGAQTTDTASAGPSIEGLEDTGIVIDDAATGTDTTAAPGAVGCP